MLDVLPEICPLLDENRLNELGPGKPNLAVRPQIEKLAHDLPLKAKDRDAALACVAGLWLLHDFFDESHNISQDLATLEGSYWHGILHRREPDYWNAKYWFRRVPRHPIHDALRIAAANLVKGARTTPETEFLTRQPTWDAAPFVDLCERSARSKDRPLCQQIQQCEWELLFQYCHERAFRETAKGEIGK